MAVLAGRGSRLGLEELPYVRCTLAPFLAFPFGVAAVAIATLVLILFGVALVVAAATLWCQEEA